MVTNISSFGRNGVFDWAVQRLTALILAAYAFCLLGSLLANPDMDYQQWQALFSTTPMRIFSLSALLSICAHGWIGMWTISTDYLTTDLLGKKAIVLRILFQLTCLLFVFVYLVWGIQILWGN
ncbi:MAG: succinate dehydrogenase, hydrophobic membrane anchor protein [Pseudohongiellaceae bacterium]